MATANFRVDVTQYLGQKNAQYRDELYSMALSNPTKYFAYRKETSEHIRTEALKNLYNVLYDALNTGTKYPSGVSISDKMPCAPALSEKTINENCLSASKTLNSILDQVMEELCPLDYKSLANARYKVSGEASQINV
jgi:hypothetical protein